MSGSEVNDAALELIACRAEIEQIDRRLVGLLGERVALARRTARLKHTVGAPILDPQREAEVIRRAVSMAREHNLPVEAVREVFWLVVGLSRRAQEQA